MMKQLAPVTLCAIILLFVLLSAPTFAADPPEGFTPLFNGKNLDGWEGRPQFSPYKEISADQQKKWDEDLAKNWRVEGDELVNDGKGVYATTKKDYKDFILLVEYKTVPKADSGIYLRGNPQVQIWDTTEAGGKWKLGADKGSGGLWNNSKDMKGKDPLVKADKPFGEWNAFKIKMQGEKVSIWLNDKLIVDDAPMRNFWKKGEKIIDEGPIQLQTHGGQIRWRNLFIKEL